MDELKTKTQDHQETQVSISYMQKIGNFVKKIYSNVVLSCKIAFKNIKKMMSRKKEVTIEQKVDEMQPTDVL